LEDPLKSSSKTDASDVSNMSKLLEGKVAVITGGSSGIGRATALAFATEGARVAIGARRKEAGEALVQEIVAEGGEAAFFQTDVREPEQVQRLVRAAVDRWGRLDCAFNNAGIEGQPYVPTVDYPIEMWDDLIATNLKGTFLAMKYEIAQMLKNGKGAIVNMSSIAGLVGGPIGVAYFASKAGVIGVTRAAAVEYGESGIRVNAICPAVIQTDMADRLFDPIGGSAGEKIASMHALGRIGTPQEVANAVVWLCSDRASFVTGHALPVDGGFTAK
jgi:NAD(P)-dependent dehydrogenase (short-subunit alcohol dehydrogenase family)